jgi:cephalosporin hydroxylase
MSQNTSIYDKDTTAQWWKSIHEAFMNVYGVSEKDFRELWIEAPVIGYPTQIAGTMWHSEMKALYCAVRLSRPKKIIEIGSLQCDSLSVIQSALLNNGEEYELHSVDIAHMDDYARQKGIKDCTLNRSDSLAFLESCSKADNIGWDFLCQDGNHSHEYVRGELKWMLGLSNRPFYVFSHDYFQTQGNCGVKEAWQEIGDEFDRWEARRDDCSNCGFVLAVKR